MKKILSLLALVLLGCMGAWAQTPFITDSWNGTTTFPEIKKIDNTNATKYVINPVAPICVQQKDVAIEAGNLTVTFQYKNGGSWGLDVVGVDLVKDGVVVKSDYHNCFTGSASDHNTFTLSGVDADTYTIRYWVPRKTHGGDDLTTTNNNSQGTITYKLDDVVQSQFTNTAWTINTTFRNLEDAIVPAELWKVMRTELFGTRGWTIAALSSSSQKYENNSGIHYYDHPVTLNDRDIYVYYRFSSGSHALAVKGVELLDANGKTVAVDFHANAVTGNNKDNCTFKLSAPATGDYTLRTIAEGNGGWSTQGYIYYYTQSAVNSKFASVKTALENNAVGYPKATNTNSANIINYDTESEYVQLCDYLNKVYAVTDINLPEDGKAYTFTYLCKNLDKTYSYYDNNGVLATRQNADLAARETQFVCKVTGTSSARRYVFVNAATGRYLTFAGGDSGSLYSGQDGLDDTYRTEAQGNLSDLQLFSLNNNNNFEFGTFSLAGVRTGGWATFVTNVGNGALNGNSNTNNNLYNNNHTTVCRIEEAEFPYNTANLQYDKDAASGPAYSTIYLPFAMTIPTGVKAYGVTGTEGDVMVLNKVADGENATDLPKGAYVLYSETVSEPTTILPAAANPETVSNLLVGSVAADAALPTGTKWVLGNKDGIGFYQYTGDQYPLGKAIYVDNTAGANKLSFRFEDVITAIQAVESNNTGAEIFDLQGRRLNQAQKGMNIINGHKVLVK